MPIERIVDALNDLLMDPWHAPRPGELRPRPLSGHERTRRALRQATAGLLFLRNKLEAEQTERRVRMTRACHAILRAAREDDDETALPLLAYRDELREHLRRAEEELAGVRTQVADAKHALARLNHGIGLMERRVADRMERRVADRRRPAPRRGHRG